MERRKKVAETEIHTQVGKESRLASMIPAIKDKEIHNNGMLWILH